MRLQIMYHCVLEYLNINNVLLYNNIFLLAGHKVNFIALCGANKSTFWPYSRKKIMCNTGKTFILLVWLLPSLCSGIKLHTRKIIFFSLVAQCTIVSMFLLKPLPSLQQQTPTPLSLFCSITFIQAKILTLPPQNHIYF